MTETLDWSIRVAGAIWDRAGSGHRMAILVFFLENTIRSENLYGRTRGYYGYYKRELSREVINHCGV